MNISDPVLFAHKLGLKLYPWNMKCLWSLQSSGSRVALRCCNAGGKSSHIAAPFILWHLAFFPNSKAVITAGSFRQVKEILWPEMRKFSHLFPGWEFQETKIQTDQGSTALGFSTNDPGLFEGHHAKNLLIVVDEAKSVDEGIFEAIARCQPNRLLVMSSPGFPVGYFYRCFYDENQSKLFKQFHASAKDCPHIPQKTIDEAKQMYGENSVFFKSMVLAEFAGDLNANTVIKLDHLERCLRTPPSFRDNGEVRAFCDFAWSANGDENVLALRRGNRVQIVEAWRGDGNTINTAHKFLRLFQQEQLKQEWIYGDSGGGGHGICDELASMGWHINRVSNGAPSTDPNFTNIAAQWWFKASQLIERNEIILPNDPVLKSQLLARCYEPDTKNRCKLESKSDIGKSPDRADAVIGAMQSSPAWSTWNRSKCGFSIYGSSDNPIGGDDLSTSFSGDFILGQ